MNLKKLERKIDREKEKLSDLCQKKADVLAKQELKAQEPEDHKKSRKKKKKGENEEEPEQTALDKQADIRYSYMRQNPIFYSERKSLKEFLAPDALDPNNYGYLKLIDGGREL